MKRTLLYLLVLAVAGAGAFALYTYFEPATDITKEKAELTISSEELIAAFEANADDAHNVNTGKVILVSGKVFASENMEGTQSGITFDLGSDYIITFQMASSFEQPFEPGTDLLIKGQYNGYLAPDDMFGMPGNIQMTQCTVESK
jgi:hypothetical protein